MLSKIRTAQEEMEENFAYEDQVRIINRVDIFSTGPRAFFNIFALLVSSPFGLYLHFRGFLIEFTILPLFKGATCARAAETDGACSREGWGKLQQSGDARDTELDTNVGRYGLCMTRTLKFRVVRTASSYYQRRDSTSSI